ncbi:MAG: hypothetical protein J6A97_00100 [Clostridia bacterium]|nr:hypothetical protein [Clostridia bacterium]
MKKELKFMLLGIYIAVIGMVCLIAATHSIDSFGFFEVAGLALPAVSLLIFIRGFTSDFKKDQ